MALSWLKLLDENVAIGSLNLGDVMILEISEYPGKIKTIVL
jgi:hypothetical protein